jgi:cephalosporin-C deacetylase-like acetyl esterase
MRINILFSYIVMNTRGRGEPMHHYQKSKPKGGHHNRAQMNVNYIYIYKEFFLYIYLKLSYLILL